MYAKYDNGFPVMHDEATGHVLPQDQAEMNAAFVALFCQLGVLHEVDEDGYWGVKDPDGNWVLKVDDDGEGEAHWYEPVPEPAEAMA